MDDSSLLRSPIETSPSTTELLSMQLPLLTQTRILSPSIDTNLYSGPGPTAIPVYAFGSTQATTNIPVSQSPNHDESHQTMTQQNKTQTSSASVEPSSDVLLESMVVIELKFFSTLPFRNVLRLHERLNAIMM
jgi:hypothetical protein